jgi:opacity protein-like surface antigen
VQQSGASTLFAPDLQIQYRWRIARFSPYVGGGVGFAVVKSPVRTNWEPTTSVGVGTGVRLTDRVAFVGELRVRGFGWDYGGSTGEWSLRDGVGTAVVLTLHPNSYIIDLR